MWAPGQHRDERRGGVHRGRLPTGVTSSYLNTLLTLDVGPEAPLSTSLPLPRGPSPDRVRLSTAPLWPGGRLSRRLTSVPPSDSPRKSGVIFPLTVLTRSHFTTGVCIRLLSSEGLRTSLSTTVFPLIQTLNVIKTVGSPCYIFFEINTVFIYNPGSTHDPSHRITDLDVKWYTKEISLDQSETSLRYLTSTILMIRVKCPFL